MSGCILSKTDYLTGGGAKDEAVGVADERAWERG